MTGKLTWNSIFRPGSIFRKGYTDSPRNRSYVIMNSVLYHLHPVKVKRHAVKVSYTLCLGGLSFFLFILLTVTGIFLMFFYRPTAAQAWDDIYTLQTSVTFGLLVRNMHRWAAHLMVLTVFLHMARVFYHGAYKPPREFNWVIGVILLTMTLLLSFTGYLLPWDQLSYWAVTICTGMLAYVPLIGGWLQTGMRGGEEVGPATLIIFYTIHTTLVPVALAVLMPVVASMGGIAGSQALTASTAYRPTGTWAGSPSATEPPSCAEPPARSTARSPPAGTTTTSTASPHSSSGTPNTAAVRTESIDSSAASTSAG